MAIVGPSGAGKDSVLRTLAARTAGHEFVFVRRTVTREADANEDHDTLSAPAFREAERAGRFALTWEAHGLSYGVPSSVNAEIAAGRVVLCNVSRAAVDAVRALYPRSLVVLITAAPAVLATRLAGRERGDAADQRRRLARADAPEISIRPDVVIENDGSLDDAARRLHRLLAACAT